jgi:hypothetical protein
VLHEECQRRVEVEVLKKKINGMPNKKLRSVQETRE